MSKINLPTPEEISAYIDDELSNERRAEVSYIVAIDGDVAQDVARMKAIDDGLRTLRPNDGLGPVPPAVEKVLAKLKPSDKRETIEPGLFSRFQVRNSGLKIAGAAAALAASIALAFIIAPHFVRPTTFADDVSADVLYFLDLRSGREEFGPEQRSIIARTLPGFDTNQTDTPGLRHAGYRLTGGRLLAKAGNGAILMFYQKHDGKLVGLLISTTPDPDDRVDYDAPAGHSTLYWRRGTFSFAAAGRQTLEELRIFQAAFEAR